MSENSTVDDQPTFEIKPEFKPKSIRSFVIRAGRITLSQKAAFDQWWPTYGLSLHNGLLNLSVLFEREAPTVLEIGFGMGDSLLEMARNEPDNNFIDRKSTRLNSSHVKISYAVFCLKKK